MGEEVDRGVVVDITVAPKNIHTGRHTTIRARPLPALKNYATHDLELAKIVHALKKWRHYLMGKKFELRTNHNSLKYLFDQPTLNVRQIRWLEFLCEYDFDIKHIKGKENKVADALSRKVHELHATTISMYKTEIKDIILGGCKC
jgi:hypothetical protein